MDAIVDALAEQNAELAGLLAGRSEDEARQASACAGWTVADVVLHLAQTNELARASVEDRLPDLFVAAAADPGWLVDVGSDPAVDPLDAMVDETVARERDRPWAEIHDRWQESAAAMQAAFRAADPHARVTWVAGRMAARTLATTRLAETWIHTGDVAVGLDVTVPPTDRLWHVTRLAWRTLPHAFARDGRPPPGPVEFDLVAPSGEQWEFGTGEGAPTAIRGAALDLCLVASRPGRARTPPRCWKSCEPGHDARAGTGCRRERGTGCRATTSR
jgi:uncharacterized protein (TIGR03084 family)